MIIKKQLVRHIVITAVVLLFLFAASALHAEAFQLVSSDPATGATGVARTATIRLTFDYDLAPTTVDLAVLRDSQGNTVSYSSNYTYPGYTVYYTTYPMSYNTTYTFDFSNVKFNDMSSQAGATSISFTTVAAPVISSTTPASGATGVAVNQAVTVNFNRAYDATSVPASPLTNSNTGGRIAGAWSYPSTTSATFTPTARLDYNTNYLMEMAGTTFNAGAETLTGTTNFRFQTLNTPANINLTVTPSTASIAVDQPIAATYIFTETTGRSVTITRSTADFLNSSNSIVAQENISNNFTITGGGQSQYSDRMYIPDRIRSSFPDGQLTYRRTFYGTDSGGNAVTVSADVAVNITSSLGATFSVNKITIDTPTNNTIFKYLGDFSARAFIEGSGTGAIEGYWYMDDIPLDYFRINMLNGVTTQAFTNNRLFTTNYGDHKLSIRLIQPNSIDSNTAHYNVSTGASNIAELNTPAKGAAFRYAGTPPAFTWAAVPKILGYKIAIVKNPNEFESAMWQRSNNNYWKPLESYWKNLEPGKYYWAVKVISLDGRDSPLSKIFYFTIKEELTSSRKKPDEKLLAYLPDSKDTNFFFASPRSNGNSFAYTADAEEEGEKTPLIQGNMNSTFISSEALNTRTPLYNRTHNLTINQPFKNGSFSFTGNWATNPNDYEVGTQVSDYNFSLNYGPGNVSFGTLGFNQSEFSLYSQSKPGTSGDIQIGSAKIYFNRISDNGRDALYKSASGKLTEMECWAVEPFKTSGSEALKVVYLKGKERPDLEVPNSTYINPTDSKVISFMAQKSFLNDKFTLGGEHCRGYYNKNLTLDLTRYDNATKLEAGAQAGDFEFNSNYRYLGSNFGTIGNPYLEKDQCSFENSAGWKLGEDARARYLFGKTFNKLDNSPLTVGAQSNNNEIGIELNPKGKGWPSMISFNQSLNNVNTEPTAWANSSITETSTSAYNMSWPVSDTISLNMGHTFTHYNDLSNQNSDTATNSVNMGAMVMGKKFSLSCNYSSNVSRNLDTSIDSIFGSVYLQANYTLIPNKLTLNLTHSKSMSEGTWSKNNNDITDFRVDYKLTSRIINRDEEFTITMLYKLKNTVDFMYPDVNASLGNIVLQITNLFNF
ncbi:MAG: Ig-like domain-containing protein [Armatimonadota bacterium]